MPGSACFCGSKRIFSGSLTSFPNAGLLGCPVAVRKTVGNGNGIAGQCEVNHSAGDCSVRCPVMHRRFYGEEALRFRLDAAAPEYFQIVGLTAVAGKDYLVAAHLHNGAVAQTDQSAAAHFVAVIITAVCQTENLYLRFQRSARESRIAFPADFQAQGGAGSDFPAELDALRVVDRGKGAAGEAALEDAAQQVRCIADSAGTGVIGGVSQHNRSGLRCGDRRQCFIQGWVAAAECIAFFPNMGGKLCGNLLRPLFAAAYARHDRHSHPRKVGREKAVTNPDIAYIRIVEVFPRHCIKTCHFRKGSGEEREEEGDMIIADYAKKVGKDPMDAYFDLLLENEGSGNGIYFAMDPREVERIYCHPRTMVGSDGLCFFLKEKGHPRAWGTFIRPLCRFAQEKQLVTFEEAVRKQTSLTADFWNIPNKGRIAEGYDADLVLLNLETLRDSATYEDSNQKAEGVEAVYVSGACVYRDKELTGACPGRFLRHEQKRCGG